MIRVHAADGTVIVSLGPSYGEWISYDEIPKVMRDATVSVEDRRFRSHIGIDPIGVLRSVKLMIENWGTDRRIQGRSEEHTSELQSLMRISYAVFCLKKKHKSALTFKSTYTVNDMKQNNQSQQYQPTL